MAQENYKFVEGPIELKDVMIGSGGWRNFGGKKTEANKSGERRFTIFLPRDLYEELYEEGWYVKHKPENEGKNSEFIFEVSVRFDVFPPSYMELQTADGAKVQLTEETLGMLDTTDIDYCEVIINPYNWSVNDKKGVKAYLDQIRVKARAPRRSLNGSMHRDEEDY